VTGSEKQIPVSIKGRRTLEDAEEPGIQNKQTWTLNRLQNTPLIAQKRKQMCTVTNIVAANVLPTSPISASKLNTKATNSMELSP
jgi:hypothetical protein